MSEEARARNTAREMRIWAPFSHSYPFGETETAERTIIFGLYANSYLNGQSYLKQIEDAELANLLADYNNKIAELTLQEQLVVADIVSKRYLAGIDKLIHDQKLVTMQSKIDTESEVADARYAALAADRAALTTMAAKVAAEIAKNTARITELQAYIAIEGINLSNVEMEIAEKELQALRVENQKMDTTNEILRLQVQIVRTSMELLDIDVQMARTQVNIAETERAIAKIGLMSDELTLEQAETSIMQSQIPVADARIALAQARYDDAEAELDYIVTTLMAHEDTIYQNKEALLNLKHIIKENKLLQDEQEKLLRNELEIDTSALSKTLSLANSTNQTAIDAEKIREIANRAVNSWSKANAAINVAETMASADIATQLTHTIQKAT
jgi:chromosome segregation ATPase